MIELDISAGVIRPEKTMNLEARERYARLHLRILRMILRHRDGAHIKGEQIGNAFNIHPRVVAQIVSGLRHEGFWVCSGDEGYCYASNLEEWQEDLEKERGRGIAILDRVSDSKKNTVNSFELFDNPEQERAA